MKEKMNLQLFAEGEGAASAAVPNGVDMRGHFDSLQRQGRDMESK